ncbi:NADH dehydrogenase [ubiquinone] 1 beta subcomplex subunit 2, mitochondrial [Pantherophis guttatus]|uniref:NADH dehydrogenase [ubiquinone] 1 beta subcomplex subunit 2, mitochondrial n=1 Tax=Pantherophis guttatus TaxID=94885 RepID=A0A6P9AS76_PANGU|nr:NADH dehydrogenase [ubiquinone] 1 beta subcomplex subunit 2, mitochondrial [Pantherophis guttatus]
MAGPLCRATGGLSLLRRLLRPGGKLGPRPGVRRASEGVHVNTEYRQFVPPPRFAVVIGEASSGLMWFWILWRFWHDPDEVLGHFPFPDPSLWTDEELGIPPDDE